MPFGISFVSTSLAHAILVLGGLVVQGHGQGGAVHPRGKRAATAPVLLVVVPHVAARIRALEQAGILGA